MSTHSPSVTMYRTRGCPFCVAAEQLLRDKGVDLEQIYLDDHPDRRGLVASIKPGHDTVPLILIGGAAIGGLDELRELESAGRLDPLLAGDR